MQDMFVGFISNPLVWFIWAGTVCLFLVIEVIHLITITILQNRHFYRSGETTQAEESE